MKNEQLIEWLSKFPKDATVKIHPIDFVSCDIEGIYYEEDKNTISISDCY